MFKLILLKKFLLFFCFDRASLSGIEPTVVVKLPQVVQMSISGGIRVHDNGTESG
jgi:hypothetical protein